MVVGKPIELPRTPNPAPELVDATLQRFISAMEELFERHKAAAGHPHERLKIH